MIKKVRSEIIEIVVRVVMIVLVDAKVVAEVEEVLIAKVIWILVVENDSKEIEMITVVVIVLIIKKILMRIELIYGFTKNL